jgi:hypothetical protein
MMDGVSSFQISGMGGLMVTGAECSAFTELPTPKGRSRESRQDADANLPQSYSGGAKDDDGVSCYAAQTSAFQD